MNILLTTDYSELSVYIRNLVDKVAVKTNSMLFVLNIINIPTEMVIKDNEGLDMKSTSDPEYFISKREKSLELMNDFSESLEGENETFVHYGRILASMSSLSKRI